MNKPFVPPAIQNSPSVVRTAIPEDHNEVWRLLLQGHKENGLFALAPEKVEWFLQRVLYPHLIPRGDTGVRGVIGVVGPVGRLEAMVFLTIGQYWYSHEPMIEEFIVYTDPEHRKSSHVHALVEWMKEQSEITKLPLLTGVISNIRTEVKCRLYRRMLPKVGEFFLYKPSGSVSATATSS